MRAPIGTKQAPGTAHWAPVHLRTVRVVCVCVMVLQRRAVCFAAAVLVPYSAVRQLVAAGADVEKETRSSQTPLLAGPHTRQS